MKGKLAGEHLTEQEAAPAREHDRLVAETREGFSQVENINGKLYKVYKKSKMGRTANTSQILQTLQTF